MGNHSFTPVLPGTTISTGFNSKAVLDLGTAEIEIKPLTRMELTELIRRENLVSTKLDLKVGKVRATVRTEEGITHDFELRSAVSTASVRGTDFEYDGTSLKVLEGTVTFFNKFGQKRLIRRGEASRTTGYDLPATGEDVRKAGFTVTINTNQIVEETGGVSAESVVEIVEQVDIVISVN